MGSGIFWLGCSTDEGIRPASILIREVQFPEEGIGQILRIGMRGTDIVPGTGELVIFDFPARLFEFANKIAAAFHRDNPVGITMHDKVDFQGDTLNRADFHIMEKLPALRDRGMVAD